MDTPIYRTRPLPAVRFRVLIAGRANAGKTSILQRVCDATESPEIHRVKIDNGKNIREKVNHLDATAKRGQHDISDELTFTKHQGYVFHDSRGFESGSPEELKIVRDFIQKRSRQPQLDGRLHAIWYGIPMDDQRPDLNIGPFHAICPDGNVPVIAVFTKYDAFVMNVKFDVQDDNEELRGDQLSREIQRQSEDIFTREYLKRLGEASRFVRLEGMNKVNAHCTELIETTVDALNDGVVTLMLLAVQRGNLEVNADHAVKRYMKDEGHLLTTDALVKTCLVSFPWLWAFSLSRLDDDDDDLESPPPRSLPVLAPLTSRCAPPSSWTTTTST